MSEKKRPIPIIHLGSVLQNRQIFGQFLVALAQGSAACVLFISLKRKDEISLMRFNQSNLKLTTTNGPVPISIDVSLKLVTISLLARGAIVKFGTFVTHLHVAT